ncbi:pyridoxal phosphate-dependent aminotransferase [Anaerovorax sp. IOR16]|uniref:pyridoxal phosphate-dependent aminotransferase n=1 Tax=Anaerovorax sp. IOR16 TaxID=2773458 RepID=UPI0019D25B2A|nr:threonine-phosphate decarboxylase [Anaerovorax sp. IOR16]
MADLIHGGDIYSVKEKGNGGALLDFSANINPLGLPPAVKNAVALGLENCVHYPDPLCRELIRDLARYENVKEENIICGNGAADLIFRLVVAKMPYKAMVLAPTFAEYEKSLESVGCIVKHHYLKEEDHFRLREDILFALNESIEMLFLCNPNNPTGQLMDPSLLRQILVRCKENNIFLVLDECFVDFLEEPGKNTLKDFIEDYNNLFILKAFTKNFAMPGLRLGYGMCSNRELLDTLFETGQPWSVSLPAQLAGVQALKENAYLEEARALIFKEKVYLQKELERLGFTAFPAAANYIFFRLPKTKDVYDSQDFKTLLQEKNIMVRSCGNYKGLTQDYFRIAVKLHEENKQLITALEEIRKGTSNEAE